MKAGDKLWYVPESTRTRTGPTGEARELTVTKVARTWLYVTDPRQVIKCVNAKTLQADGEGYSSPGRCHLKREEYEAWLETSQAWDELLSKLRQQYHHPEGMTAQRIRLALGILQTGGDTDPLKVIQALLAQLPNDAGVSTYHAREELAAVRRLFT